MMTPIKEVVYKPVHFNEDVYYEELAEEIKMFEFNDDAILTEELEAESDKEANDESYEGDESDAALKE